jgi:hypothetical protein
MDLILIFSLKPEVDERRCQGLNMDHHEEERTSRDRQELEAAQRSAANVPHHTRNDSTGSTYFATPPPSAATPLHAELEPTITRGLRSPTYRERSSEDPWVPSSSYIVTPPSATIALPDLATAPIKSTLLPIRQIEFCPSQSHRKYTSPPIHPAVQSTGLFTPPPSASPPPVMRSPDYIMIPKSHFASVDYVWPPLEEVASPRYEELPSPTTEEIASPSYSPIPTLSDPGTPPPIGLEVTVETPIVERKEDTMVSVNTEVAGTTIRPLASRQVSFGMKRPRPRSPVGIMADDRPLAKRQSLPCMPSRSTSRSDSPLSPAPDEPDEDMMEEDEVEENEHFEEEFEDGPYGKQGEMNTQDEEKEDEGRLPSPGPSPSPSIPDHQDSDFDSEVGCGPAEFDDEPEVFSSHKVSDLILKSVDEVDLKTLDLGKLLLECDITDELAGLLEAWI